MRLLVSLLAALVLLTCVSKASAQNFDIVVVMGESNGMAVGTGPYFDPLERPDIDNRMFMMGHWPPHDFEATPALRTFNGRAVECVEGWKRVCDQNFDAHAFIIAFARRYIRNNLAPGRNLLIVCGSGGGTSVLEWNGKLILEKHPEGPLIYSDMIGRLRYLLSFEGNRLISVHMALGEADVIYTRQHLYGMSPTLFGQELSELIARLHADLPPFTLVANRMSADWMAGDQSKAKIENVLIKVVTQNGGGIVSTYGLGTNADSPEHFSAMGMRELGQRHYQIWAAMPH